MDFAVIPHIYGYLPCNAEVMSYLNGWQSLPSMNYLAKLYLKAFAGVLALLLEWGIWLWYILHTLIHKQGPAGLSMFSYSVTSIMAMPQTFGSTNFTTMTIT